MKIPKGLRCLRSVLLGQPDPPYATFAQVGLERTKLRR